MRPTGRGWRRSRSGGRWRGRWWRRRAARHKAGRCASRCRPARGPRSFSRGPTSSGSQVPVCGRPSTMGPSPRLTSTGFMARRRRRSRSSRCGRSGCPRRPARRRRPGRGQGSGPRSAPGSSARARSMTFCSGGLVVSGARNSTPCAAQISSTPRMALRLRFIRPQAAGAVGGHADVILLIGRGRRAIGRCTGLARCLFSLIKAAVVTSAIIRPEFRPGIGRQERRQVEAERRVDHQRDAALGDGADLGEGQRDLVGGEGHRFGVEVAARDDAALGDQHQRIVGDGVGLDLQRAAGEVAAGRSRRR